LRPFLAAVVTEIDLCNVCSCQEISRRHGRAQDKQALVLANGTKVPIGMLATFTNVGTSPRGSVSGPLRPFLAAVLAEIYLCASCSCHEILRSATVGPGQWWARLPIPAGGLGPRCSCDMDVNYKPADYNCGEPAVPILESVPH
jgi:hypothetical protein